RGLRRARLPERGGGVGAAARRAGVLEGLDDLLAAFACTRGLRRIGHGKERQEEGGEDACAGQVHGGSAATAPAGVAAGAGAWWGRTAGISHAAAGLYLSGELQVAPDSAALPRALDRTNENAPVRGRGVSCNWCRRWEDR